mmetsp:Transcript_4533/g.10996  ORF Transcript_4533/g.10996 Transcript_4533/m.10996 type:complete len:252 (-) Transcript_4533:772-1527(-)
MREGRSDLRLRVVAPRGRRIEVVILLPLLLKRRPVGWGIQHVEEDADAFVPPFQLRRLHQSAGDVLSDVLLVVRRLELPQKALHRLRVRRPRQHLKLFRDVPIRDAFVMLHVRVGMVAVSHDRVPDAVLEGRPPADQPDDKLAAELILHFGHRVRHAVRGVHQQEQVDAGAYWPFTGCWRVFLWRSRLLLHVCPHEQVPVQNAVYPACIPDLLRNLPMLLLPNDDSLHTKAAGLFQLCHVNLASGNEDQDA